MSLESLTAEERRQFEQSQQEGKLLRALINEGDPAEQLAAKRLLKKRRPDLRFPDLEAAEAEERAKAATLEETQKLREELAQEKAQRLKAEEVAKIQARGYDPEAVYKAMNERGITVLDTALAMFDAEAQLAESTAGSVRTFKNPADDILKDVKPENGPVDVDQLRSKLINNYMEERNGRKTNPLGFLRQ